MSGAPAPRENPHLVGQDEAERVLGEAWTSGRLPHAWLLTGARGIGKATLAFRFARLVLGGGGTFGADGPAAPVDPLFRRVAAGAHPDLRTLEPTFDEKRKRLRTEIRVEEVRTLGNFLRLTPAEGDWRIVVVDSADVLNPNAANALLKLLEEPPARSLLLLVSHAPGGLLPTIRSRCRRLPMRPLPEASVLSLLRRYSPDLAPEDAELLARLGTGSIGHALELAGGEGTDLYRRLAQLLLGLPRVEPETLHAIADRFQRSEGERAFRTATLFLTSWLGRLIEAGATGRAVPEMVPGEGACMRRLLAARSLDHWVKLWEKMTRLFVRVEGVNLDRKQVWVTAILDLESHARP